MSYCVVLFVNTEADLLLETYLHCFSEIRGGGYHFASIIYILFLNNMLSQENQTKLTELSSTLLMQNRIFSVLLLLTCICIQLKVLLLPISE